MLPEVDEPYDVMDELVWMFPIHKMAGVVHHSRGCRRRLMTSIGKQRQKWEIRRSQKKKAAAKLKAGAGEPQRDEEYGVWREKMWDRVRKDGVLHMPVLLYAGKDDILDWGANEPRAMLRGQLGLLDIIGAKDQNVQMIVLVHRFHSDSAALGQSGPCLSRLRDVRSQDKKQSRRPMNGRRGVSAPS